MEQIQGAMGRGRGRGRPILSASSSLAPNHQQYTLPHSQTSEEKVRSPQYEAAFEHDTSHLNQVSLINALKSRLSGTSKPYVSSHSFGQHEQRKVIDANNNIRVTIKKQHQKTKPQYHSTQAEDDDDLCTVCDRPTGNVMCTSCGSVWRGRVRTSCPIHSRIMFLMDSDCCTQCQSKDIVEVEQ